MMLRNQSYPPNESVGRGLMQRREVLRVATRPTGFDLERGKDNNVNKHKKMSKYLQEIIICMVLVCNVC